MAFAASVTAAQWMAGAALAGTAMSAVGQIQAGQSQSEWNNYNAAVAERDTMAARDTADIEASRKRRETQKLLGKQRALYGKAGVTFEGSPLELMEETAAEGELDAMMIQWEGGQRSQKYVDEATLSRMKGKSAKTASYYGAGSSLLTGGAQTYAAYKGIK